MKYKHQKYQGGLLMASYTTMYTRNHKGIKTRMETIIGFYGKGNEIISWCLLCVGSCLVNGNCHYMCCHHWNTLHQINTNRIGMTTSIKVQKLSLVMTTSIHLHVWQGKRWKTFIFTWASFSNAMAAMVSRNVSWAAMHSFLHEQRNKWICKSSMVWLHWHYEKCTTIWCGILKWI